jgi:hypothetical protein
MTTEQIKVVNKNLKEIYFLGYCLTALGCFLSVPTVGEFSDVIWAPIAAYLMTRMYKGLLVKWESLLS